MTRLTFVSDTHEQHGKLTQQVIAAKPDVLVHCGDFTGRGHFGAVSKFADWCAMLLKKRYAGAIVVIAGNHDISFDETHPAVQSATTPASMRALLASAGVVYLQDSGAEIDGKSFYGSPWTPRFYDWGFQLDTDEQARKAFKYRGDSDDAEGRLEGIPQEVDVLITHGPPYEVLDLTHDGRQVGSKVLADSGRHPHGPKIHAFGHIHHSYGMRFERGGQLYINASTCTEEYKPTNPVISLELR